MHPQACKIFQVFSEFRTELVTNGDFLTRELLAQIYNAGIDYVCVSMYDGPHQVGKFNDLFNSLSVEQNLYALRDRWHDQDAEFGLKLTNRAGSMPLGPDSASYANHPCYYFAYSLTIDWNGDVLHCIQDWQKRVKYGNLNSESIYDVWTSERMSTKRRDLIEGKRTTGPCKLCNADGTIHGANHAASWLAYQANLEQSDLYS